MFFLSFFFIFITPILEKKENIPPPYISKLLQKLPVSYVCLEDFIHILRDMSAKGQRFKNKLQKTANNKSYICKTKKNKITKSWAWIASRVSRSQPLPVHGYDSAQIAIPPSLHKVPSSEKKKCHITFSCGYVHYCTPEAMPLQVAAWSHVGCPVNDVLHLH